MAKEPPQTIGDMRRKAIVTNDEIAEAVEAYLLNPKVKPFEFASGHILDVAKAVQDHPQARAALAEKKASDVFRRTMARTAVILATPSAK